MKFRVDRDVLADAVAWAARSLPVRPSVPVLSGLLIEASDDGLVLSTFDYETSARATLSAEVSDEGKALVSGRLLSDICRSLPAKPVEMVLDGSRVSLTCGSARFSLQTMPVEDYPALPDMPAATGTVSSDVFAHAVPAGGHRRRSRRHAAGAHRRPDRDLRLDDLDAGHRPVPAVPPRARLAPEQPRRVAGGPGPGPGPGRHRPLPDRRQRGDHRAGRGRHRRGHHRLRGLGARRHASYDDPLLDGEFPKVRSLFPNEHQTTATVDKAALIESLKRVALVAERNTAVQLAFSDGTLTLDAGSGDEAQASESIEATIQGEDITTGFNPQFLLDGLQVIDEAVVELAFTGLDQARCHQWFDGRQ